MQLLLLRFENISFYQCTIILSSSTLAGRRRGDYINSLNFVMEHYRLVIYIYITEVYIITIFYSSPPHFFLFPSPNLMNIKTSFLKNYKQELYTPLYIYIIRLLWRLAPIFFICKHFLFK